MTTTIALVSCTKDKHEGVYPARQLYSKSWNFRASLELAERAAPFVYILSAKHGLVELDQPVAYYQKELQGVDLAWGFDVAVQLAARHLRQGPARLVAYAGYKYVESVRRVLARDFPAWDVEWVEPLKGLGTGERKTRLKQLLSR